MTKRIIICCDGTWNNPEQKEVSNVVKVSRALRRLAGMDYRPVNL